MKKRTYTIIDGLEVTLTIEENPLELIPETLFQLAARMNKKRSFLFVSPVLGKHLPVNPSIPLLIGRTLALEYGNKLENHQLFIKQVLNDQERQQQFSFEKAQLPKVSLDFPVTIIGFCETATALGHAFFESFSSSARYIHTTREEIEEQQISLLFEEEHSHAVDHRIYAKDKTFFDDDSEIILVDDEVTTGKTNLNIIRAIVATFPTKRRFTIVSILDWRKPEEEENFRLLEQELGIHINELSLLKGTIEAKGQPENLIDQSIRIAADNPNESYLELHGKVESMFQQTVFHDQKKPNYLMGTGRFGIRVEELEEQKIKATADQLQQLRYKEQQCLVIGTGEFMYIPMKIASLMGPKVVFHTTTRSPILSINESLYPISAKRQFSSVEQKNAINYVYTISDEKEYGDIFVVYERVLSLKHLEEFNQCLADLQQVNIYFVDLVSRNIYKSVKRGE